MTSQEQHGWCREGRIARSLMAFGLLVFAEGSLAVIAPQFVVAVLQIPELSKQAEDYFRLAGLFACAIGIFYIVCARLGAGGFTLASLITRSLVPPIMALLCYLDIVPWTLALFLSIHDFVGFLWTFSALRAER